MHVPNGRIYSHEPKKRCHTLTHTQRVTSQLIATQQYSYLILNEAFFKQELKYWLEAKGEASLMKKMNIQIRISMYGTQRRKP